MSYYDNMVMQAQMKYSMYNYLPAQIEDKGMVIVADIADVLRDAVAGKGRE